MVKEDFLAQCLAFEKRKSLVFPQKKKKKRRKNKESAVKLIHHHQLNPSDESSKLLFTHPPPHNPWKTPNSHSFPLSPFPHPHLPIPIIDPPAVPYPPCPSQHQQRKIPYHPTRLQTPSKHLSTTRHALFRRGQCTMLSRSVLA